MIVVVLLVVVLAAIAAFAVALAVRARREFREQNEVVPGRVSSAPASWAGAHTPEARLHRRLRDAVASAHTVAEVSGVRLGPAVARVDSEAVALDDRLVAAASLPERHRGDAVQRLEPLVASLEDTVAALVERISGSAGTPELMERTLDDTDIALDALARARAEIEKLDRDA